MQVHYNISSFYIKGLRISLSLFFSILWIISSSQILKAEYIGAIVTNQKQTLLYNLHIKFDPKTGELSGYSTTDRDKKNETISLVKGKYYADKNFLKFSEYKIQETKSKAKLSDMCFIHFEGKLFQKNVNAIKGKYKGKYKDGSLCSEGSIYLASKDILISTMDSVRKNKDTVLEEVKKEIPLVDLLRGGETRYIKSRSDTVLLTIWDDHKLDNDIVDIHVNGKLVEENLVLSKSIKSYRIETNKSTTIKIKAKNVGYIAPNTSKISIKSPSENMLILNELDNGQTSEIKIIKEK